MTLNWMWKVFFGECRNMARANWFTGRWAKISWKSPWQQSHPLKTALVGFSFCFSISCFSSQFVIAAKSLGMQTSVHGKVRGGFLYFFKACWGGWEFSPGFLKLLWDPKEKWVLFYRSTSYFCYITNIDLLDSKWIPMFLCPQHHKGLQIFSERLLSPVFVLRMFNFFGMAAFTPLISIPYPTIITFSRFWLLLILLFIQAVYTTNQVDVWIA